MLADMWPHALTTGMIATCRSRYEVLEAALAPSSSCFYLYTASILDCSFLSIGVDESSSSRMAMISLDSRR